MLAAADRPVVLLHGCGGSRESTFLSTGWLSALTQAGRFGLAPHLPGHGTVSGNGTSPGRAAGWERIAKPASHDPATYADLAGLLMPELPTGAFDLVGFSLGAKLALEVGIRAPDRVGRLVLGGIGDNVFAPESIGEAAARALEEGATDDTPAPVLAFLKTWEPDRNDALAIAAVLRRPPNPTFTERRLRSIRAPVLIVNGDADPVARLGPRLTASLDSATHVTLLGVDHFGLPAQPAFIGHAIEFLNS
jgi:pimeloyl-ACP methyl ester carboxylesterase